MTSGLALRVQLLVALTAAVVVSLPFVQGHGGHDEGGGGGGQGGHRAPVVMISMDGFRFDYLSRIKTLTASNRVDNYFAQLAAGGVWAADGVGNVFATKTFPNHYTLVTGLYEETHGVVENFIFDRRLNRTVHLTDPTEQRAEYFHGTPIWVNFGRQRSAKDVACYMWIGCNLPIDNFTLPKAVDYRPNVQCDERVKWLSEQMASGVELTLMYIDEPDATGHMYGPDSKQLNDTLIQLNHCLGRLLALIPHSINVLLVSDHGMMTLSKNISIAHNDDLFWVRGQDYTEWLIDPKPGNEKATIDYLRAYEAKGGVKVYQKEEIPDRWHYGHNVYVSSVLVVAEPGYRLLPEGGTLVGGHGYDNTVVEMRPTFLAMGPSIVKNHTLAKDDFRTLDVYLLIAALLGLEPSPNNGSCSNVRRVLAPNAFGLLPQSCRHDEYNVYHFAMLASILSVIFALCMFLAHRYSLRRGQQRVREQFGLDSVGPAHQQSLLPSDRKRRDLTAPLLTTEVSDDEDDDLFSRNLMDSNTSS
uniref:Uncharacterized protein n=1 Tax=Plectus sambesii TaxID=2011161 RepID=A0A914VT04_9BILA